MAGTGQQGTGNVNDPGVKGPPQIPDVPRMPTRDIDINDGRVSHDDRDEEG